MGRKKKYSFGPDHVKLRTGIKTGEPPGALIHVGEQKVSVATINVIQYNETEAIEFSAENIDDLKSKMKPGMFSWINVDGIHDSRIINDLGALFELENLSLEDIMNTTTRPKFEEFDKYIFIIIKDLHCPNESAFDIEQISMILKENVLISFQELAGDVFDGVRHRIRNGTSNIRTRGTDYLLYSLVDAVIDNYFIVTESYDHYVDNLEELLYTTTHKRQLGKIKEAKSHFNLLKRTIYPMKEMIYGMHRSENKLISKRTHIYVRDLHDHINNITDTLDQSREKVNGLMGIYQSGTNSMMNNIFKTLTIVSTIFMALSLIAGIYGMNFAHFVPGGAHEYGFYIVLGMMFITTVILIVLFRIKRWL